MNVVLQSYASPARKIDARLDRDHRAGREADLRGLREAGRFVDLEADPVAQRVTERLAEARLRDEITRQGIGAPSRHPRPDPLARRDLRPPDGLVYFALAGVGRGAHHDGPGEIGAIATQLGPEIEQQPFASPDRARTGPRV